MQLLCETNLDEPHHDFREITYCSCPFSRCKKITACIKYAHANKKRYSSIVDAAVQHDILHNQIKENIVIISNWKGTFIKCKTCKRILTGKKGWFGKK